MTTRLTPFLGICTLDVFHSPYFVFYFHQAGTHNVMNW